MFKIIQISDLHFGREEQKVMQAGEKIIQELNPDLIVVAGDLTQRNWSWEYFHAAEFLKKLNRPIVIVPGNHDIPLFNLFLRFRKPLKHYDKYFNLPNLSVFENDFLNIRGLNSVNRFQFKNGKLRTSDLENTLKSFQETKGKKWNILITHHPFSYIRKNNDSSLLNSFLQTIDLWLSGHSHRFRFENLEFQNKKYQGMQCVSGTFISNRLRSEENGFNLLEFDQSRAVSISNFSFKLGKITDKTIEDQFIKNKSFALKHP